MGAPPEPLARRLLYTVKRRIDRALHLPVTLVPHGHFYSPIVDPAELQPERVWGDSDEMLGVDLADDLHRELLRDVFPRYIGDFDYPEHDPKLATATYYVDNPNFSHLDSRALFALLRHWRPRRILEVGSGFSSLLMADVNVRFLDEAIDIACIEPYPPDFLRKQVRGISRVVERKVQDCDLAEFQRLEAGDVLFIDSSHVAKTGSDVNYLVFDVLPRLVRGVRIHFHDIFFPKDYPPHWVIGDNRSWNEQYLLRALLMYSPAFRITFGSTIAYERHRPLVAAALGGDELSGGSLWIEKVLEA